MKKKLLLALSTIILFSASNMVFAKTTISADLSEAIRFYKQGNYVQCYTKLDTVISKDPSNSLAYYYKGMAAAQMGRKDEAIASYEKSLTLAPKNSNLIRYAEKGKRCLEFPDACRDVTYESSDDEFIRSKNSGYLSEEARGLFEKLKIEQMMRDMNRQEDINPQRFKEYKDFSSMNNDKDVPTNDEIVAAVRTLQNAGLLNFSTGAYSDLSLLMGQNDSIGNLMNSGNINPQLIQTMLTNSMSLGF